jgi:hypothetical protein
VPALKRVSEMSIDLSDKNTLALMEMTADSYQPGDVHVEGRG